MSDLLKKEIGKEGNFQLKFEDMKLKLIVGADTAGVDAGLYIDIELEYFLDKLKDAIPGTLDDTVIELIKAAAKS